MDKTDRVVASATVGSVLGAVIAAIIAACFPGNKFSFKVALKDKDIEGEVKGKTWTVGVNFHPPPHS